MAASVGRNAGYNLIGAVLPIALSLITVPVYLALIGPERYGVLTIAWLFLGYFGLFDLGLGRATAYRIAAQRDAPASERAITFWTAALVNPALGLVGGAILYGITAYFFAGPFKVSEALRPEIMAAVPWLAAAVPIATLTGTLTGTLQGREQFLKLNSISVSSTALFQLLPLALAWWQGPYLPMLLAAAMSARLLGVTWLAVEAWRAAGRGFRPRVSRERFRDLLGYGGWVSISALIGPLLVMADRFAIGAVVGATAVAIYAVPYQLVSKVQLIPAAINSALMPRLSAADAAGRAALSLVAERAVAAVLTPALIAATLLLEPGLRLWLQGTYEPGMAETGRVVVAGFWLFALSAFKITLLYSSGRPRAVTTAYLIELPFYFATLWLLMRGYGLIGCAWAFVFRSGIDLIIQGWMAERRLPGWPTLVQFALLLGACAVGAAVAGGVAWAIAAGSALVATSAVLGWIALPEDGRALVKRRLPRRFRGD